jgi:hypothetical protein
MKVYFDESGTHDGWPYLCVAGYIIESKQAEIMTREWNEAVFAKGRGDAPDFVEVGEAGRRRG